MIIDFPVLRLYGEAPTDGRAGSGFVRRWLRSVVRSHEVRFVAARWQQVHHGPRVSRAAG